MMKYTLILAGCLLASPTLADPPRIEAVAATDTGANWRFDVTLSHPDSGWEHYADGWRVLDMQGNELGLRVLAHPHEHEQPFTRSLGGVALPDGARQVKIQARCLVDGWNAETYLVDLN
jgi:hypothetical protein